MVFLFLITSALQLVGQNIVPYLEINFNNGKIEESNKKITPRAIGTKMIADRFGNENSAIYFEGNAKNYLNLGTDTLVKPKRGTISFWIKIDHKVYAGKGYEFNPILLTKNSKNNDFFEAYCIGYDYLNNSVNAAISRDSIEQRVIRPLVDIKHGEWYHLVMSFDETQFIFYFGGKMVDQVEKNYHMQYDPQDSVLIGYSGNEKNYRFFNGTVDDILYFDRILSNEDVDKLFHAPNPNKISILISNIAKVLGILFLIGGFAYVLSWKRHRDLDQAKTLLEDQIKWNQMEMSTLKAQMNPHFIFNALNSLNELILTNQNEKAQKYLTKFSMLIRKLLESNNAESLTIAEELDILKRYIEIESLRFSKSFHFNLTLDTEIDVNRFIPHMLIQPYLENAIWHGLLPKDGDKLLDLSFHHTNDKLLQVIVEDNGVGRGFHQNKTITFKKQSLAHSYVKSRLELMAKLFQVDSSVEIIDKQSQGQSGTKVILQIPYTTIKNNTKK